MSTKLQKFSSIIERIEYIRHHSSFTKTKYAETIGLKPQTYSNFIGVQNSKPSIDLIHGVIMRFGVNPLWLLYGYGDVFLSSKERPFLMSLLHDKVEVLSEFGEIKDEGQDDSFSSTSWDENTQEKWELFVPVLEKVEREVLQLEKDSLPAIGRLTLLLERLYRYNPSVLIDEILPMMNRVLERIKQDK